MSEVLVDGFTIGYERRGTGPALVLLHGYVGDGPSTWRLQLEALSDEFTVIAWDAPGAGRSSAPPESFGMAGYADCLAAFLTELGLGTTHIVGLSFGGALAIEFCRRHRAMVATLTLVGAYAGWAGSLPAEVVQQRLSQAFALSRLSPVELVDTLLPTMFGPTAPAEVVETFRAAMLNFQPAGLRAMAQASAEDLRTALPGIDVPTLLIYGTDDIRAPAGVADHLHEAIRGSTLARIPDAGHVCNIEAADAFNGIVRAFVRRHVARSGR